MSRRVSGRSGCAVLGKLDLDVGLQALVPDRPARRGSASAPCRSAATTRPRGRSARAPCPSRTSSRRPSCPRLASWMAPVTISAELAVSPLARTTSGRSVAEATGLDLGILLLAAAVERLVDDAVADELAGDADRLVDVAARVAADVEDDLRWRPAPSPRLIAALSASVAPVANWSRRIIATVRPGTIAQLTSGRSNLRRVIVTSKSAPPSRPTVSVTCSPSGPRTRDTTSSSGLALGRSCRPRPGCGRRA